MAETASLIIKVDSSGAERATRNLDRLDKAAGGSERVANRLGKAWGVAIGVIGSAAVIGATRAYIRHADTMANLSARVRLVTDSLEAQRQTQERLFNLSQRTSTELGSTTELYVRLAQASDELRDNQERLFGITEAVSKSMIVSGSSTSEAASSVRQFSQAMASGVLRGDEFNSIMENAPRLARAIADGLDVPVGALRKMAEQGELTSERVVAAVESQADAINREFSGIPVTVGRAMQQVRNSLQQMVGDTDRASGATSGLAESIQNLARALESDGVRNGFTALVTGITNTATAATLAVGKLNELWEAAQRWTTFKLGGTGDVTNLQQIRYEIEKVEESLANWEVGGIKELLAGPDIARAKQRLEELRDLEAQSVMLFGDPSQGPAMRFHQIGGATPDDLLNAERTGRGTGTTNAKTTATKELATATRELTAAEQEALAYSESLNAVGEETLRQRGQTSMAILDQQNATRDFIADLGFERSLIGLSNVEREKAIALRYAGVDATTAEGRAIGGLIEEMERAREAEGYITDAKRGLGDLFSTIGEGSARASDAFSRMIDNMKRRAMDALADRAIDGLLQGFAGMAGGGGWGGFAAGFAKGFGGGRAGGGPVMSGQGYWVGETGREWFQPAQNGSVTQGPAQTTSPRVTVNIHNAPQGAEVRERRNPMGDIDIDVMFNQIESRMAQNVAQGTGSLYAAQKNRFGLREPV